MTYIIYINSTTAFNRKNPKNIYLSSMVYFTPLFPYTTKQLLFVAWAIIQASLTPTTKQMCHWTI